MGKESLFKRPQKNKLLKNQKKVVCKFCGRSTPANKAHLHNKDWVCTYCWDDRLKTTE